MMMKKLWTLCMAGFFLVACASGPEYRKTDFAKRYFAPMQMAVIDVEVLDHYGAPLKAPFVEHRFSTTPSQALRQFAQSHFVADGSKSDRLVVTINQASVKEVSLAMTQGIKGAFYKEQSERYELTLEITVDVVDQRGFKKASANARIMRTKSVAENITLADRLRAWDGLLEDGMRDVADQINREMQQYLASFVVQQ